MKTTTTTTALRLLAVLFIFCLFAPMAAGQGASTTPTYWEGNVDKIANAGDGKGESWDDAILIATAEELAYFAQQVNSNKSIALGLGSPIEPNGKDKAGGFKGYYFALSANIDLEEHYWKPIGTEDNPFNGNFDGQGHCVSGLKVNVNGNSERAYVGLFGKAANSTLQNLGVHLAKEGIQLKGVNINGLYFAGGIAGQVLNIHNCYVVGEGSIKITGNGDGYAGGIVGNLCDRGQLTNCYATVNIKIETNRKRYAGGIAGLCNSYSTISCTYASGDVDTGIGKNNYYAGGICGYLPGTIKNCLALNGQIIGNPNFSNRIVGSKEGGATLTTNYASREIVVNGNPVNDVSKTNENGDPSITFNNLQEMLKVEWEAAWTFSSEGYLPQLKLKDGEGNYTDWPEASPQPFIDAVASLPGSIANAGSGDGSGWNKAIQIANRAELAYLAKQVNAGNSLVVGKETIKNGDDHIGFEGYYFALSADIDLEEHYWKPIGAEDNPFNGNFDGQGYCVSKLKVDGSVEYGGLFGYAAEGTLRNIGVHLAKEGILATSYAGGIAGQAANISNCYVVGEVNGKGTVKAKGASSTYAGGIVGRLTNTLKNCYATVDVIATGTGEKNIAGGIAAQLDSPDCSLAYTYATGAVEASGSSNNYAGGICGDAGGGTLSNNLALNTSINGSDEMSHRIVGNEKGSFYSNYASTIIKSNGNYNNITFDRHNGSNTWIETFRYDLIPVFDYTGNEWSAAWEWDKSNSGNLPKLKIVKDDENGFSYEDKLTGQPDIEIKAVLETSADFPFELIYTTYLAYNGSTWLRSIKDSQEPTIPFNGTVNGGGLEPIIINALSGSDGSGEVPKLVFERVRIYTTYENEKVGTCLTVNEGVEVILEMKNSYMNNNTNMPVIANAGNLTIKAENEGGLTVISANDYAIKNTGRLTLEGNGFILTAQRSAIDNDASVIYKNPMVEWQFASGLSEKSILWFDVVELVTYYSFQSIATSTVPPNGGPFIMEVGPADQSSLRIPQQGRDINNNYTGSFTANGNRLTVYTDVKDYPRLYLKQPAGGTLTVTDADGSPLSDGDYVAPGTQLTLSCSSEANYDIVSYQSGPAADNLSALSGNKVTIGDADIWLSANLRYYDSTPPTPIYYSVYLPQVEGASTDPGPGEYEVESWSTFRFYLTIDSAYSDSQPVVTTDRGETLEPRSSDGAYLVKYVRSDVEVFIDGLIQNPPPVANEAISADALAPQIWAEGTMLCIRMPEALPSAPVRIFTADGRLYDSFASTPGLSRRQLPTGVYIVRVGDTACKVIIK